MKIQKIVLNNFRGFPGPLDYEFNLRGKNLLLFGENGSGKSSLYRALVELFQPGDPVKTFANFRHTFTSDAHGQSLNTGLVRVEFKNATGRPFVAEWTETQHRTPFLPGADAELDLTARSLGCLDYRAMLETNFIHRSGGVNLFSLIVKKSTPTHSDTDRSITKHDSWTIVANRLWKYTDQPSRIAMATASG